jgi:hypothetical protein
MTAPFSTVPVPRLLWESFEVAMNAKIHRLAKDIATTLGESDAPLLKALKSAPVKAYLAELPDPEMDLSDLRCDHLCCKPNAPQLLQPCGEPIVWSTATTRRRCPLHLTAHSPNTLGYKEVQTLCAEEKQLYCLPDQSVVSATLDPVGFYVPSSKTLVQFTVESES